MRLRRLLPGFRTSLIRSDKGSIALSYSIETAISVRIAAGGNL
jgi:hypothetical protein